MYSAGKLRGMHCKRSPHNRCIEYSMWIFGNNQRDLEIIGAMEPECSSMNSLRAKFCHHLRWYRLNFSQIANKLILLTEIVDHKLSTANVWDGKYARMKWQRFQTVIRIMTDTMSIKEDGYWMWWWCGERFWVKSLYAFTLALHQSQRCLWNITHFIYRPFQITRTNSRRNLWSSHLPRHPLKWQNTNQNMDSVIRCNCDPSDSLASQMLRA